MPDMNHLDYLDAVAAADLALIRHKEKTYQGSWKKRGGAGAFFVLARKWDRLENILAGRDYDIFDAISEDYSGADGSVLAEIRDLRCYLTLVEAHMRGVQVQAQRTKAGGAAEPIPPPGTPEDGGHHARYEPLTPTLRDGPNTQPPWQALNVDGWYLVDREFYSEGATEHLPRLFLAINHSEWDDLPVWYKGLYAQPKDDLNYRLKPEYHTHWGRG